MLGHASHFGKLCCSSSYTRSYVDTTIVNFRPSKRECLLDDTLHVKLT